MASQRFKSIFERNAQQFVGYFSEDANSLFKNDKNRLIHPGEYGMYRERACKHILKLALDRRAAVSDGFVLTKDDQITKQCDIIVYNRTASPIITDGIAQFFPAEEVRMIGEVKSTISSKQEYSEVLCKLAENKKTVLDGRGGVCVSKDELEMCNTILTFLICNKLDFEYKDISNEEIYGDIERKYWHNIVLSLEDGLFLYSSNVKSCPEKARRILEKIGYDFESGTMLIFPVLSFADENVPLSSGHSPIDLANRYDHIIEFFSCLFNGNQMIWEYLYDPIQYLGCEGGLFCANE